MRELINFASGPASERNRLKANYLQGGKPDVVVTTYEAYCAEANFFKQQRWSVVVLDEG